MQERSQFARDGDDRAFLRIAAPTLGEGEAPAAQIAVGPKRPQDVLRAAHE